MDSVTGKVFASPESSTANDYRTYTAWLVAVDTSSPAQRQEGMPAEYDKVLLMEWKLEVKEPPNQFIVNSFTRLGQSELTIVNPEENAPTTISCGYDAPCAIEQIQGLEPKPNSTVKYSVALSLLKDPKCKCKNDFSDGSSICVEDSDLPKISEHLHSVS